VLRYGLVNWLKNSARIVTPILSLVLFIVLLTPAIKLHAEDGNDKKILSEITDVFKTKGEEGLRDFAKKNKERISTELIKRIADKGVQIGNRVLLSIALIIASEKGDGKTLADVYFNTGLYYYRTSQYVFAFKFYETALQIYKKLNDLSGQGKVYGSEGDVFIRTKDNAKALKMYKKALTSYSEANNSLGQGMAYKSEGDVYLRTGDNAQALEMYEKALPCFVEENNPQGQGDVYAREGQVFTYTGDYAKALEMYGKALSVFVQENNPQGQGTVYAGEGQVFTYTGDNAKALEMYEKALPIFNEANYSEGLGQVYAGEGDVYSTKGNYLKALEMYEKALPFFVKLNDSLGQGNVYRDEGDVYLSTGDNAKALEMYEKALLFFVEENNPQGQGNVYRDEGDVYLSTGDNAKAWEMYEKALPFFVKANDPMDQGNVYQSEGDTYLNKGDSAKALEMYDKALTFFESRYPHEKGIAYQTKGDVYLNIGDNAKALEMYEKALGLYTKIGDIEGEAYALFGKARVSAKTGRVQEAVDLYENGLIRFEKVRKETGFSEMKKTYMKKVYSNYEEATIFMLEHKYNDNAFKFAESMKARVFLDQLAEGLARLEKGIDPELKKKRDGIENRLSALHKQIASEVQQQGSDEIYIMNFLEIVKNNAELEEVIKQIRLKNTEYAKVQYPEPVTVKKLQDEILKKEEAILEYFISKDGVYCFVITSDKYEPVKLKATKDELEKETDLFLEDVKSRNRPSMKLYGMLIQPLEGYIKDKSLIIIPDGILTRLPFEALMLREKKKDLYLLEKDSIKSIKYVQSASVLEMFRTPHEKEGPSDRFIGFGDPVYDYENFKAGKPEKEIEIKGEKWGRLADSGIEVTEIEKIFEGKNKDRKGCLRLDAREENAKSPEMGKYGYIHYSTHGMLHDRFQAIVLSQIPDSKEDGLLTLGKIMNSKYNAKLVVLSACETGLGKIERGEGVTGLTRAVMYAGTPAVVVSLWSVAEGGTKELMVRFYKNMIEKDMTKENALREAKKEMLTTEYKYPFFWSAFVMYGE
jgi:CHAT domain-containing protein/predicted negative regulator of RcsB-dependent stress response